MYISLYIFVFFLGKKLLWKKLSLKHYDQTNSAAEYNVRMTVKVQFAECNTLYV